MANAQIVVTANTRQAEAALGRLNRSLGGISSTAALVSGAIAGIATQQLTSGILNATKAYEGFRTQLTTYLGSQQRANAEIERLSKLARTLPQDVNEVTQAFVIFSRFGLDTSNESLRAFSNIAAANSKSITQLGEAVADALTGEFERLKEFGIKVSKENDQFVARIGDQQVALSSSTKDLVEQLKQLGAEGGRFGNVTVGPLTLAMSNLRGAVIEAQNALGAQGFALAVSEALTQVTDLITNNDQLIEQVGRGLTRAFLYAKEVVIVLVKNLDILGYTLAAIFGISITRAVIGFAGAIAGPLVSGVVLATKAFKALTLMMIKNPLIALGTGLAVIIEKTTGAFSGLAESIGLIGEDSVLDDLVNQGKELAGVVTDEIGGAFEYVNDVQERVNAAEQEFNEKAQQVNKTLDEQANIAANVADQEKAKAVAAEQATVAFREALAAKQEEYRFATLSAEQQELINLEKEIEKKLSREITEQERQKLQQLVKQSQQQKILNELKQKELEYINDVNERASQLVNEATGLKERAELTTLENIRSSAMAQLKMIAQAENMSSQEIADAKLRIAKDLQRKIDAVEMAGIERRLMANKNAIAQNLSAADKAVLQRQGQEERQQEIVRDRIEFEKKSEAEKSKWAIDKGAEVFSALGQQNKKAFEAAKALNIASALMNTYMAATKALATYPWPFGLIAAAAAVAAGMAQVSAIRSQTYSGRQLGGPVLSNQSYIVGENGPEMFTPTTNGSITRNNQLSGGGTTNVNFTIVANDTTGFDELLTSRQGLIRTIISDAMLENGRRSMV